MDLSDSIALRKPRDIGIRWSSRDSTFDDARAMLAERPDSAGNDARKIMDQELPLIAEKLITNMPFLAFGEKRQARSTPIPGASNCRTERNASRKDLGVNMWRIRMQWMP